MEYKHTVALRLKKNGQIGYVLQFDLDSPSKEPMESCISLCDKLARNLLTDATSGGWGANPAYDGVIYKVGDSVEYFISKYYFKYPNTTDTEDYHVRGKDRHQRGRAVHREQVSGRRGEGDRKTQRRAA